MKQRIGKLKNHYYAVYTIIFLILCLVIFSCFWLNGKSFVWVSDDGDGLSQHLNAYIYYGRYLRTIAKNLLVDHTLSVPAFSFSLGFGSDVLTTLQYYVIGDPICLLTVFVPTSFMLYFYQFSILLRLYLAGIAFSQLCFYVQRKGERHFGKTAIIIGAFIYIFCGFSLYAGVRHPYFINPMIYFPWIILGIEKTLDKKKPYVFTLSVFLCAVSNFYFFYMIVILTVLYVVWRLFSKYNRSEIRTAMCSLGKITGYSILGTGMSAVVLVPTIMFITQDARAGSGYTHTLLYTLQDYEKTISGFIGVNSSHDWLHMGYAAIALIAVFLLFMQGREYRNMKVVVIITSLMLLIPIVGRIMNGFSYVSNRWVFAFSLLISYIAVLMWDKLFEISVQEKLRLIACVGTYFLLCMLLSKSRTIDFIFAISVAFVMIALFCVNQMESTRVIRNACIVCVFVNIAGNAFLMYSPQFNDYVSEFVDMDDVYDEFKVTEATAVKKASSEDDFTRYSSSDSEDITLNNTLYSGLHSTQYYWSLSNGNITQFQREMGLSYPQIHNYSTLDSRTALSTLANVNYYVQDDTNKREIPYEFSKVKSTSSYKDISNYLSEKLGNDYDSASLTEQEAEDLTDKYIKTYNIYENREALPFGYTYNNYITRNTYESLTPIQKQEAMLQGVVVEEAQQENEIIPSYTSRSIDFSVDEAEGVQIEGNEFIVKEADGKITLSFKGLEDSENYLYITGLNFEGFSPTEQYTDVEWQLLSDYDKNQEKYKELFWNEPTYTDIEVSSKNTSDKTVTNSFTCLTSYDKWYSDQHDYMVNLYYDELPRQSITICFSTAGRYTFDDLKVLCQPMDSYNEQVSELGIVTMNNVDFHDDNSAYATSEITGSIVLDQTKYLLLTIPYSDGWKAYVDGNEQGLIRANTMFMALKLDAGDHNVVLKYHTPGGTAGVCISIIALCVFLLVCFLSGKHFKNHNEKEKEQVEDL